MNRATYLIGFSKTDLVLGPTNAWLSMAGIESYVIGDIKCWIKEIERDDFDGPEAEKNLANLDWLTPRVLAHDTAVTALSNAGSFIPARFGTLFSSTRTLADHLAEVHDAIAQFLAKIYAKREWRIKCFVNRALAISAYAQATDQALDHDFQNGTNYLKARQRWRILEQHVGHWLGGLLKEIEQLLEIHSTAFVSHPLPNSPEMEVEKELLGNFAVLASDDTAETLHNVLCTHGQPKLFGNYLNSTGFLTTEMSGPWPVYSFAVKLDVAPSEQFPFLKSAG